jgi:uncharacterized protein
MPLDFRSRYGPWAAVAGGSEGLGAAFATALAARGLNLVLLADGAEALRAISTSLAERHRVEVRTVVCDLADSGFVSALERVSSDVEIGLGVYNAAHSFVAPFFDRPAADALRAVDVNCSGPIRFAHAVVPAMIERRRGGLVLMASLAGFQGTARLSAYAASKAFNIVLGESLWAELAPRGVDVVVSCPGAIRTPTYQKRMMPRGEAPGILAPEVVAERTLDALGHGPRIVPGVVNRLANLVLGRLLPRTTAVSIMGRSTASLSNSS